MNSIKEVLIHLRALKELDNVIAESQTVMFKDCEELNNKHVISERESVEDLENYSSQHSNLSLQQIIRQSV